MGIRSGYASMIIRAGGFEKVKNYEGSLYEWSGDASMPMEK
ncbi:MAG: thiosulfate/3-mercaptopyruvate sulfurtransferase [Clostridium sp.]|jgi:thiosulfate/3-mercaptopyruvate sulfurtransferase|nr:rhodanese-like domain-containing protein [Clostridium sp.]